MTIRNLVATLFVAISFDVAGQTASAQGAPGTFGVGIHLGDPSGLSFKIAHAGRGVGASWGVSAYDLLLSWKTRGADEFFIGSHLLFDYPVADPPISFYYGPGLFLQTRQRTQRDDDLWLGVSGNFGIDYFIDRLELYVQITPRLSVVPDTQAEVGGGFGARFFF